MIHIDIENRKFLIGLANSTYTTTLIKIENANL